ncbi:AAA family ATPase [Viridibacillus sp. YIM B01967]|uniref:AAA family ATPase n=1 Tax=Viridibacillus soli TaxID=2798301 RepID=A0ABS1HA70_9BACL|nr:kinase [Viridibacillus soli]MBK3496328.1 AAA family ATPase [Viridibacillus soli]
MCVNEIAGELLYQFSSRSHNRPLIVAIDGLSGAGKTTLVKNLECELKDKCKVTVIHIDDHIVERNKRYNTGHEEWYEYYYLQWDIKMITNKLLEKIYNNSNEITLPFYDHSTDTISTKEITVTTNSIVLIEGIFLQRKEWRNFYDLIIFLDCPLEMRYERVLHRDSYIGDYQERLNKYKRRYWLGEEHYFDIENPIKNADQIYNVKKLE